MKAFISHPFIAPEVRWKMFWTLMPSTLSPRGLGGRGSWVMTEMLNLAKGYTDNPGNIRMDNITGKIQAIGQAMKDIRGYDAAQVAAGKQADGLVVLSLPDTRVGGRGLDLNFKGKGSMSFNGYHRYKMLIIDPQLASEAHYIQAQGASTPAASPRARCATSPW